MDLTPLYRLSNVQNHAIATVSLWWTSHHCTGCLTSCCLTSRTMLLLLYLCDGPHTTVQVATLRPKLRSDCLSHPIQSTLTLDQPVPALTLWHQAPGRVTAKVSSSSYVFPHLGHECQGRWSRCDGLHVRTDQTSLYTLILLLLPSHLYLWGSPFWVRVLHMWPFSNPPTKVSNSVFVDSAR